MAVKQNRSYSDGTTKTPTPHYQEFNHPETGEPLNEDNSVFVSMKVTRTEEFPIPVANNTEKAFSIGEIIDDHIKGVATDGGKVEDLNIHISPNLWDRHFAKLANNEKEEVYY